MATEVHVTQNYTNKIMIITKLLGGLGNQMFQYAAGAALASRTNSCLLLDVTTLKKYPQHQGYQLDKIFAGDFKIASKLDLLRCLKFKYQSIARSGIEISSMNGFVNSSLLTQKTHNFDDNIMIARPPCYLSGYWQSWKYFDHIDDMIRRQFKFKHDLSKQNASLRDMIQSQNSVSVHVRRGDYVQNLNANKFHGTCSIDYYVNAIDEISRRILKPSFFIFSDDPVYARKIFSERLDVTYIDHNIEMHSYLDMQLISLCKHHIIANSSFSWWGAWLSNYEAKTIIAPKVWFSGSSEIMKDIYKENWILM